MRTRGNGPDPCGYQTRPLRGNLRRSNPQYHLRKEANHPSSLLTNGLPSIVRVLIPAPSPNSGLRSSPLPYVRCSTVNVPTWDGSGRLKGAMAGNADSSSLITPVSSPVSEIQNPDQTTVPVQARRRMAMEILFDRLELRKLLSVITATLPPSRAATSRIPRSSGK